MKVLSIVTDRKIFEENSPVRGRMVDHGKIFEELHIIVFALDILGFGAKKLEIAKNVWAYPTNSKSRFLYIFDAFRIARRISKSIKLKGDNFVITTQDPFETGTAGLVLKWVAKMPLNIQVHTDFTNRYFIFGSLLNFIRFPLGIFVLSFADSVRTVSERILGSVKSLTHNVSVLPVYSQINGRGIIKQNTSGLIKILTVCRLEKEKDLKTALAAFKKVLGSGVDAEFTIVGDGSQRKCLELMANSLNIGDRVKFVGWQNNPEDFYSSADIYVSTSLYEGYGMAVVEAASRGIPVVISNTGVAGSLFIDGESALVFGQKDIEGFASGLIKLSKDLNLRKTIGDSGRRVALSSFLNIDEYLKKYKYSIDLAAIFYTSNHGLFKKNILLRYLVAGVTGASTQIGTLYIFTDIFNIWYLYSSVLSFLSAIVVSFTLQKFWTFGDLKTDQIHNQIIKYVGVAFLGLGINTIFMYIFVDLLGVWYILAQIIIGAMIAVLNFLMYKFFIFNK